MFQYNIDSANKAYIAFVVTNNHSFTLGEEPAFRQFISQLQPLYKPLGATAVKDRLMRTYVKMRHLVIEKLSESNVALTTDLWTSPNNIAFMGITVAMWTESFRPMEVIIGFKELTGEHSGANLASNFYDTVMFYKVNDKVNLLSSELFLLMYF